MAKRVVLTPAIVDALVKGHLIDPHMPGLRIEAGARGRKIWRYRRRLSDGTVLKMTLGRYPAFTIAAAREWACELNAKVEAGIDPRALEAEEVERRSSRSPLRTSATWRPCERAARRAPGS